MGDTSDGSSSAAQGALEQDQTSSTASRGLFGRIIDAISPTETEDETGPSGTDAPLRPDISNLRRLRVEDVCIPGAEIVAVPASSSKDELYEVFRESGLTRLPVYEGTLDTPIGLVHLKDFALKFGFNGNGSSFDLKALLRPLLFVPPSMPLSVLMQKMQADRTHMALMIDEYGGTDGLVTIEDLIEQVLGDIEDEHDVGEGQLWTPEDGGTYLVRARTPLEDFEKELGVALTDHDDIDEEEIDTLGGLVFMLAGHVPARGEVIPHPEGLEFEVVDADPRRIKRLRVRTAKAASG